MIKSELSVRSGSVALRKYWTPWPKNTKVDIVVINKYNKLGKWILKEALFFPKSLSFRLLLHFEVMGFCGEATTPIKDIFPVNELMH